MATITVTSTADSGAGSLRQALSDAASGDTIEFDSTVFPVGQETIIYLSSVIAPPNKQLVIDGGELAEADYYWAEDATDGYAKVYVDDEHPAPEGTVVYHGFQSRVVLHAQNARRCVYATGARTYTFRGLTFRRGYATGTTYGGCVSTYNATTYTFEYCSFENSVAPRAGAVYNRDSSNLVLNNCCFDRCHSSSGTYGGGAIAANSSGPLTAANCRFNICYGKYGCGIWAYGSGEMDVSDTVFYRCGITSSLSYGGAIFSSESVDVSLSGCSFSYCGYSGVGTSAINCNTSGDVSIVNCSCSDRRGTSDVAVSALANSTVIENAQGGKWTFRGDASISGLDVEDLVLSNNTGQTYTFSGENHVDTLQTGDGDVLVFNGIDCVLAVTTDAIVGEATFQNGTGSTGYFAAPVGTDLTDATFTGVKSATYGAGASGFSAAIASATTATLSWSATSANVPVLLEIQNGGAWNTLASATSPYTATASPSDGRRFRLFDGVNFLTSTTSRDPRHSGFYVIDDWAISPWNVLNWTVRNWDVANWVEAKSSGGDDDRDEACAFTVNAWAIDPELYD